MITETQRSPDSLHSLKAVVSLGDTNKIYNADCISGMRSLEAESIDQGRRNEKLFIL